MKKKLTILNTPQFGTLTDSLKWCEYLRDEYDITFICFDSHLKRMDVEGVSYRYLYKFQNPILRGVCYIIYALVYCLFHSAPVFIVYFEHCDILPRLLPFRRFHVDIRTLAITDNEEINKRSDKRLKTTVSYFKSASFISKGIMEKIKPQNEKLFILPLGADAMDSAEKKWQEINLLYVGALQYRDIYKTVEGLSDYVSCHGKKGITYDVIGEGPEIKQIIEICKNNNLTDIIHIHGKVPYDELSPFFKKCNVGISFVPIRKCYQYQPPTKTFEYILSGLYCIATKTCANEEVIVPENGILIEDSKEDFCKALERIRTNSNLLDSKTIRDTLKTQYTWERIVKDKLVPIIENML